VRNQGILVMAGLLALAGGAFAGAPPQPAPRPEAGGAALDPALEALLEFATDTKGLTRLRHKGVVARLQKVIPMTMTKKEKGSWVFRGQAAQGPVAEGLVAWEEYAPTFRNAGFRLRTDKPAALEKTLLAGLERRLGKPTYLSKDRDKKTVLSVHWFLDYKWDVSVGREHPKDGPEEVVLGVEEYREPEESEE
jgi:hypothetical protein